MDSDRSGGEDVHMENERSPLGARTSLELLEQLITEVDARTEQDRAMLLSDLLCAAWPSESSQDQ
jgi:hypothetical protein